MSDSFLCLLYYLSLSFWGDTLGCSYKYLWLLFEIFITTGCKLNLTQVEFLHWWYMTLYLLISWKLDTTSDVQQNNGNLTKLDIFIKLVLIGQKCDGKWALFFLSASSNEMLYGISAFKNIKLGIKARWIDTVMMIGLTWSVH